MGYVSFGDIGLPELDGFFAGAAQVV